MDPFQVIKGSMNPRHGFTWVKQWSPAPQPRQPMSGRITGVVPPALSQPVAGAAVGIFDPLGQLAYRVDVLRVARGLLAEGIEDPVVLSLEVFINSHGKPPEDDGDPYPEAKPAQYPSKDPRPIARNFNALWSIFVGDFD
jgi:hypothetical protein